MCAPVFRKLTPPSKGPAAHRACAGLFIEVHMLMLDEVPLFGILPPANMKVRCSSLPWLIRCSLRQLFQTETAIKVTLLLASYTPDGLF